MRSLEPMFDRFRMSDKLRLSVPDVAMRARRCGLVLLAASMAAGCASTGTTPSFDSTAYLRERVAAGAGPEVAAEMVVPFELREPVRALVEQKLAPGGDARFRIGRILDHVFRGLELEYRLAPTLDATDAYIEREGNCLSFVNLFVALGRHMRLAPFYVEVQDYQRWDHREGMVVSQGHIVAGLYVQGELETYDFLPYRVKSYRSFQPIDDLTAAAHFYNNLGAEALLAGDEAAAQRFLEIATRIAPDFVKASNNLGVWHAREGRLDEAISIYREALDAAPDDVPLMTNLIRAYQQSGRSADAEALLAQLDGVQHNNPFFFVYQGEAALARGEATRALEYLRDALRLDTETPEVHVGLTKTYVALGELDSAAHHLERAIELDPRHPDLPALHAMLQPAMTRPDEDSR